jgi:hypothetical protein
MTTIKFNNAYARRRKRRRGPRQYRNESFVSPRSIRAQRWLLADRILQERRPSSSLTAVPTEGKTS